MALTKLDVLQNYLETLKARNAQAYRQVEEVEQAPTDDVEVSLPEDDTPKNGGSKNKFLKGVGYVGQKTGYGALRTIEGISDLLVGGVADLIGGENGDEFAERVMKNDWINYSRPDEWYNPGTGMQFVGDVGQGVGGMLPAVAVALIPGVGQAAAGAISTGIFTSGAIGQSTSEAVKNSAEKGNEDALTGKEWLYGGASGLAEVAIEKFTGGIGGTKAGTVLGQKIGKSLGAKAVTSFVGEGVEEVFADLIDPALKRIYDEDVNLGEEYSWDNLTSAEKLKQLGRTFAVGGATGAAMGGASNVIQALKSKGFNNVAAAEYAQALEEQQAKANKKQANGKEEGKLRTKTIQTAAENLSKRLQRMADGTRQQFLELHRDLAYMFNADGTLVEGTVATPAETTGRAATQGVKVRQNANVGNVATPKGGNTALPQTQGGAPMPQGGVTNAPAIGSTNVAQAAPTVGGTATAQVNMGGGQVVSPTGGATAMNNNATVQGAGGVAVNPTAVNGANTSVNAGVDNSVENTKTSVNTADFNTDSYSAALKGYEGNLAYKPISNTSTTTRVAKDVMNTLTKLTDGKAKIVLTEDLLTTGDGQQANGLYKDGIIYLDANATDYQKALFTGVHEVVHTLEGTKAYNDLATFVAEQISKSPALQGKYGYEKYRAVYDSILEGDWTETTRDYQATTEIFADFIANEIAIDPKLVNSIAARNKGFLTRLLNWVRNSISKLGMSEQERAMRKGLTQMEKLLADALEAGTGGRSLEQVEQDARAAERAKLAEEAKKKNAVETEEAVDKQGNDGYNKEQGRYSVKTPYIQWKSDAIAWANSKKTKIGDMNVGYDNNYAYMYEAYDPDGDGRATDYRVISKVSIANQQAIDELYEEVEAANEKNHASLYENFDEYGDAREQYQGGSSSALGRYSRDGRNGSVSQGKSQRNGERNYQESNRVKQDGGEVLKSLTEEQAVKRGIIDKKGGRVRYNLFTFNNGGKQILESNLKKNGFTQAEINETAKTMQDMADYFRMLEADVAGLVDWNSAKVLYDAKTGNQVFRATVKNGDYPLNIDLSTICKKRKALTKVLNTLVKRGYIDTVDLSAENLVKINEILRKYKYEVACPACFVETKRYRVDDWANKFLDPWNELIKNAVPNAKELDFANGVYSVKGAQVDTDYLNRVIKEHTKVNENGRRSRDSIAKMAQRILEDESVRGYLNKSDMIGSIGLEKMKEHQSKLYSLVLQKGGTSTPKIIQEVQPYNGELGIYKQLAKKAAEVGGVRMFSFSDFTVQQTFDYLQVAADLSSQRATMQTYTKEITFAELFGQTGMKINLSMIPAIDKSVGKENAGLDAKGNPIYSKDWGVSYNDAKNLMSKEGYNGNVGTATIGVSKNHILKLLDDPVTNYIIPYHKSSLNPTLAKMMDIDYYTDYTAVQNTRDSSGEKISATEAKKFNFFTELAEAKDARKMAQNYLDWCKQNNYTPKFDEFAWHPNYYKLLVDFQVYKNVDGKEVYAPQNPVQMKFPDNFKDILKSELKTQEELDTNRDVNFEKVMDETLQVLQKGTVGRAQIDVDKAYLEAVEKNDTATMEKMVAQAAKDAGYNSQKLYHGTAEFGFTNLKTTGVEEGVNWSPFFATNNPKVAETYSGQSGVRKIGKKDSKAPPKETLNELTQRAKDSIGQSKLWWTGEIRTRENVNDVLSRYRSIMDDIDVENLRTGKQGVWAANGSKDVNRKGDKTKFKFIPLQEGYTFKDYAPKEGNYELYANTKNLLVVEGKGAQWNKLDSDYGKTTRQISEKARDLGYSGTLFKNIVDLGFWADSKDMPNGASDVYVFFNPETQVKSADAVTYDDNGKVIPLSERFKSNKTDIRFSLDVDLADKTSKRVQTVVHKESVQEVWDRVMESIKYGSRNKWLEMQISLTDEQAGIVQAGRNLGLNVNGDIQRARSSKAAAVNMITVKQTDYNGKVVGESLKDIFKPIQKKGEKYAKQFNEYLLHQLNVDRMSAVERGLSDVNKPVFEEGVDKAFSAKRVQELEAQFPSFKAAAEKVWKYSKNLLQYRVDAGLITQAQADLMNEMYPHYVPAYYDTMKVAKSGMGVGKSSIVVRTGIKSAKGSSGKADLIDVSVSLARQTESVVKAAAINKVVEKLYDKAVETNTFIDLEVADKKKLTDPDVDYDEHVTRDNQIAFYKDGERIVLDISEYMYQGFEGLGAYGKASISPLESIASNAMDKFKRLVTSASPFFTIRNAARDFGDAWFHTKYRNSSFLLRETKSFFRAMAGQNSEYKKLWDTYVAMGGFESGYYEGDTGVYDGRNIVRKGISKLIGVVEKINNYIEQTPRFAEFVASVKAGNSYERALYDAAEVTTNFSRGGKLTKKLNRTLIPFLNPAVQGWSKEWRTFVDPMDRLSEKQVREMAKTGKGRLYLSMYGQLIMKAVALGIGCGLLNNLMNGGLFGEEEDEEYANLPLNVKENNFLIPTGNGKFIKIPKGRVVALYAQMATRITEYANGDESALNAWDWFKSAWDMMSPIDAASRTIFAPIGDVIANRTWYGTAIESRTMEQMYEAKDRYDENTSSIAIKLGQAINVSPKKIHYVLEQYSGFLGDLVLPWTTQKAEQNMFAANFVTDPEYTNTISTKYYDLKDEITYAKNSGDLTALMAYKYLNACDNHLSDIYKAKRDIANYNTLSTEEKKLLISSLPTLSEELDLQGKAELTDAEKREYTNILQALLNGALAQLTENVENFQDITISKNFASAFSGLIYSDMYNEFDESKKNSAYNKAMDYYYAVYMAEMKGEKLGYKYVLYDAVGANETCLYLAEISKIESDKDRNGNTISGSRKRKVQKYIQSLRLSAQQKNILLYLAGYTPTDAGKGAVNRYLLQNGFTRKEINEIWN